MIVQAQLYQSYKYIKIKCFYLIIRNLPLHIKIRFFNCYLSMPKKNNPCRTHYCRGLKAPVMFLSNPTRNLDLHPLL